MQQIPYASFIAVILCGSMTAPLWLDRTTTIVETNQIASAPAPVDSHPAADPEPEPAPTLTPEPAAASDTRLACGCGIISRLRNRGDRCVEVPQPYAYPYAQPSPAYGYTQPCVPAQPVCPAPACPAPSYPVPACPVPTQPIYTQPVPTQPAPQYVQPTGPVRGDCNCQECCKEFQLTRWRVVPVQKEVTEDYIDCVVETSTFCDSSCEQGDCLETIGIQNRKSHVVVQKPRVFTVTELRQETVIEKRCVKCGCIKETRPAPSSTYTAPSYETQKPVLEDNDSAPASESRAPNELPIRLRQSQKLKWQNPNREQTDRSTRVQQAARPTPAA